MAWSITYKNTDALTALRRERHAAKNLAHPDGMGSHVVTTKTAQHLGHLRTLFSPGQLFKFTCTLSQCEQTPKDRTATAVWKT